MIYISDMISIEKVIGQPHGRTYHHRTKQQFVIMFIMNNIILMIYVLRYLIPFSTAKLF